LRLSVNEWIGITCITFVSVYFMFTFPLSLLPLVVIRIDPTHLILTAYSQVLVAELARALPTPPSEDEVSTVLRALDVENIVMFSESPGSRIIYVI